MHEAAISRFSHQIIMTMMMDNNDENSNMRSILHPLSILRVQGIFIFPLLKNCGCVSSKAFRISDDGKTRLEPGKSVFLSKYLEGENGLQVFCSKFRKSFQQTLRQSGFCGDGWSGWLDHPLTFHLCELQHATRR